MKDEAAALLYISQNDDDKLGINIRSVLKLCNESLGRVLVPIRLSAISNAVDISYTFTYFRNGYCNRLIEIFFCRRYLLLSRFRWM